MVCIEKTKLRTKETFSLVLIERDVIEKRSDNFTEEWLLVSKCICQSNVKSFKSVADDIRQPKLSQVKLWTQKRVNSLLPGKDKTRANKLKTIKSHLRSNKQNQGWKIKLHYVVADVLIEGHCICLLQQICCLKGGPLCMLLIKYLKFCNLLSDTLILCRMRTLL